MTVAVGALTLIACGDSATGPDPDAEACLNKEGSGDGQEIQNLVTSNVLISGGTDPMPADEFATYDPPPPYILNSSVRSVLFVDSCTYRSPDAPASCTDHCGLYRDISGYTWLELATVVCSDCLPTGAACTDTEPPPPGVLTLRRLDKCQTMTFTDEIYDLTDPYGNRYVMHTTGDDRPATTDVALPDGWTLTVRPIDEPMILQPSGDECSYTILRDNLDQGYHQYGFDGEDELEAQLTNCAGLF